MICQRRSETIAALKEKFKTDYIVDIMLGRATSDIRSYGHEDLEVFGCAGGSSPKYINTVIQQAIIAGYIERGVENYGILKLTRKGKQFLKEPVSFKIVEDADYADEMIDEEEPNISNGAICAADPELFSILTSLRRKIATSLNLPPICYLPRPSLEAMATTYPITIEELANISGVGMGQGQTIRRRVCKTHPHIR